MSNISFYTNIEGKLELFLYGGSNTTLTGSQVIDNGKRHMVTATYDGTDLSLYVDGQLDANRIVSEPISTSSSATLTFGGRATEGSMVK